MQLPTVATPACPSSGASFGNGRPSYALDGVRVADADELSNACRAEVRVVAGQPGNAPRLRSGWLPQTKKLKSRAMEWKRLRGRASNATRVIGGGGALRQTGCSNPAPAEAKAHPAKEAALHGKGREVSPHGLRGCGGSQRTL